jgi:hypothetical protein
MYKRGHKSSDWGLFFRSTRAVVVRKKSEALNLNSQRIIYYFSSDHPEINMMGLFALPWCHSAAWVFLFYDDFFFSQQKPKQIRLNGIPRLDSIRFEHFASI